MAAKRKRAKKKNPTKKRRHKRNPSHSPKKRAAHRRKRRANPKRRHARKATAHRRVRRANPKRRHTRSAHRRTTRRNPIKRRSHKRRHKRNPGIPMWAMAGLAAGLGLVTYAVGQAGSFAITQRTDPSRATLDRNRYIGFGVLTAAGLAIAAFASPILGAGVAAGGLMGLGGTELSLAIGRVVDKTEGPPAKLAAVYGGDRQQFGAVYDGGGQKFGAVFQQLSGGQNMGATYQGGQQTFNGVDEQYFGG